MKIITFLSVIAFSLSSFATDLVPKSVKCPVYELKDDATFDTTLQSVLDGDEDYAWLGFNRNTNNVTIGYYGWSYPEDHPEYKVSIRTSGYMAFANIVSSDNKFKMSYDHRNGCITLRHAFIDHFNGKLSSGNIIAQGRCGGTDLKVCNEQPNLGL